MAKLSSFSSSTSTQLLKRSPAHWPVSEMCVDAVLKVLQGCNGLKRLVKIHAHVIICGLQHHPAISSKLLNFCAVSVSGCLVYARLLFAGIQNPLTQDWNSMIRGFAQSPFPRQAILYYNGMVSASPTRPDTFTFSFALKACEGLRSENKCREVHACVIRDGFDNDVIVCTNLIRSYSGHGSTDCAQKVFDAMSDRDLVSWNSMISSYSQAGLHDEALGMYHRMRNEGVEVDGFTLVGLLSSCAHIGALNFGISMHRLACGKNLAESTYVGNALIDMYAKCGSLERAASAFDKMKKRDVFSWNSIIVGHGMNGQGRDAIRFFHHMLNVGLKPNSITFLGVLCGCSHQGLVNEGVEYFDMMRYKFMLKPGTKHFGCMVDLFGRAGMLERALDFIRLSAENDPVLWRILLGSCRIHNNVKIGEIAMMTLHNLGKTNPGDCMLLATIYAEAKETGGIASMRRYLKDEGIRTTPGWSSVEIGDQIHKFVVDDKSHPEFDEINRSLRRITRQAIELDRVEDVS